MGSGSQSVGDGGDSFSVARSRALDRVAVSEHGMPSLLLMEQASIGIAIECLRRLPASGGRVEVLCGPGNNGGDGLACARHLFNAGVDVTIWELVPPGGRRVGSDPAVQLTIARRIGIPVVDASSELPAAGSGAAELLPDLRVDAIFGSGLSRPPEGIARRAIERLLADGAPVLSADIPSGLDADRGTPLGIAVEAAVTVTLGLPKRGFLIPGAQRFTGELRCVPIGVSRRLLPPGIPAFPPAPVPLRVHGDGFEFGAPGGIA